MMLAEPDLKVIAGRCGKRWDRYYARSKLRADPVYSAVVKELDGSSLPVLDIGCGIGLLAHYLRGTGQQMPITGFDYDPRKISSAKLMVKELRDVHFSVGDARTELPAHEGHVVILDILQFFTGPEQDLLLREAARRVGSGGKLIIRSGLRDESWRFRATVMGDWLARWTFWMKAMPVAYPTGEQFQQVLGDAGLQVNILPLWGGTPFNNHLIVAVRPA